LAAALPLPAPATPMPGLAPLLRIASPDRAATATLLALGVRPVACVDKAFYDAMGGQPPMPRGIPDCGDPNEPNLELLLSLGVDHCVTGTTLATARAQIATIVPVLHLDIYDGTLDALQRSSDGFRRVARLVGSTAQAEAYIRDVDVLTANTRAALVDVYASERPVYLETLNGDGRSMVVYGRGSIMHDVLRRLGLRNAWTRPTNLYGFAIAGVEALASAPDANVIVIDFGMTTTAALEVLSKSPFWNRLPMVTGKRVFRIPLVDLYSSYPAARAFLLGLHDLARRPAFRHA
jgi:ferric hydroxamate transport system substrate-binding protein